MRNIAEWAQRLSTTRSSLFGMSFWSTSQSVSELIVSVDRPPLPICLDRPTA
jgi:hypothetical protein